MVLLLYMWFCSFSHKRPLIPLAPNEIIKQFFSVSNYTKPCCVDMDAYQRVRFIKMRWGTSVMGCIFEFMWAHSNHNYLFLFLKIYFLLIFTLSYSKLELMYPCFTMMGNTIW